VVTEYHSPGNLSKTIEQLPVKFVAGRLCLDFVNTVGGRDPAGTPIRDKISSYQDLLAWSVLASMDRRGAIARSRLAARDSGESDHILARAIRLREALYRIFRSVLEARQPAESDADALRDELSVARAHQVLTHMEGGFAWTFDEQPAALDRVLWPIPLSAAELLTSSDLAKLRQCAGAECGWLFLDTSRNRRRQWCDMQDCGNRAKVRRFRQRQLPVPNWTTI
jgi:predicted RNA-binding Zn ribbon-like protein